jgi:hypothetical protein
VSTPNPPGGWPDPQPAQPPPWQQPSWQQPQPPPPPLGATPGSGGPPGYGYPPPGTHYPQAPKTNQLAVTAMVVSISSVVAILCSFCCSPLAILGLGGGVTGTILGFMGRRQIQERGEQGDGMALAGIIVGFVAAALGLLAVVLVIVFFGLSMRPNWTA